MKCIDHIYFKLIYHVNKSNFWSPDNLFLFPYKHALSVDFSGEETTFTDCLTKVSPLNRQTTLLEITKERIIQK